MEPFFYDENGTEFNVHFRDVKSRENMTFVYHNGYPIIATKQMILEIELEEFDKDAKEIVLFYDFKEKEILIDIKKLKKGVIEFKVDPKKISSKQYLKFVMRTYDKNKKIVNTIKSCTFYKKSNNAPIKMMKKLTN